MTTQFATIEKWSSEIWSVILDYPSKRNCLSKDGMLELIKLIEDINKNEDVKVIVLTHDVKQTKVFSSGHDLKEIYNIRNNKQELQELFKTCNKLMTTIHESPIPIICMINGMCTAAGFELALSCDMIICTANSKYMTPGVNLGLFCHTPSVQLSRNLYSNKHAMQIL